MGQVLIRNLDDAMVEEYRQAAKMNGRSLEAELRDALKRSRPERSKSRRALADQVSAQLADLPPGPSGADIIRKYRDTNGGGDVGAY